MLLNPVGLERLKALLLGTLGGALFFSLDIPLSWLLGALTACLLATLGGIQLRSPGVATHVMRAVLGVAIGAGFSPDIISRAGEFAVSLVFVPLFVVVIGLSGYFYFRCCIGFDRPTAFFSAMPGGFQDMLSMGEEKGANTQTLSSVHATRVILLVFLLPWVMQSLGDIELGSRIEMGALTSGLADQFLLIACGVVGWFGAKRLRIAGGAIVGPMVLSAIIHASGLTAASPPVELIYLAQLVIGIHIGCQYQGARISDIAKTLLISAGFLFFLAVIAALFVAVIVELVGLPPEAVLIAYSPGGQAEMNLIALSMNIDIAYVSIHHLFRMVLVIIGAQIFARMLFNRGASK